MKKSLLPVVSLLCAALAFAAPLRGEIPRSIAYQGYLTDAAGAALEGEMPMIFRLYDQPEEGNEVWNEVHAAVQVDEGRFAAPLGELVPLPADFSRPLFLEIQVGGEVLLPRLPLRSVPYALQAARVAAGAVDSAAVADGAIGKAKLGADLAGAGLAQNADGSLFVAVGGVGGAMIAEGTITNSHIAAGAAIAPAKIGGTAVTLGGNETLINKTLQHPVLQVRDSEFTFVSGADPAHSLQLQLSPLRNGEPQLLTFPAGEGTLALEGYVDGQIEELAAVAFTGQYADLHGLPVLADVAGTGSFTDLGDVPAFARLDQPNIFTATGLPISLEPGVVLGDGILLQVVLPLAMGRGDEPDAVFTLDAMGNVVAASFAGDGALLSKLDADALVSGTVSLGLLPDIPAAKVEGLATVATSGSFADLAGVPAFARLDQANTFTAAEAIVLDSSLAAAEAAMMKVWRGPARNEMDVFSVDATGNVVAASFAGDGALLSKLDADALVSGTVSLGLLPDIPAAKVEGLADVSTSGSFEDLVGVPAFARLDQPNIFTATGLPISLEPGVVLGDGILLQVVLPLAMGRGDEPDAVFTLDAMGNVVAASFAGDGALLSKLDADALVSGTVSLGLLPDIPAAKVEGLATVATSGSFADLGGVPAFARLDQSNTFAPGRTIALDSSPMAADDVILKVYRGPLRDGELDDVFSVDATGNVVAASFAGDGSLLSKLDADALVSGTVSLGLLPDIPAAKVEGLADVSTSGSFEDLVGVPAFARLDQANTFTANSLPISLEPDELLGDDILFRIMPPPPAGRPETPFPVFSVNGYGVTTAASFVGDGGNVTGLNADHVALGTLGLERLPQIPPAKLALDQLAGRGLHHDLTNGNLGVDTGPGLAIDGAGKLVPDVDDETIGLDGEGKLALKSVASVPVVLATDEPALPQHGTLIYKDGFLQVYNDPEGAGGTWVKVGTYQ